MTKYKLTRDSTKQDDKILYRIQAVRDFGTVRKGERGGFIESEKNLSHEGTCWIYHNAKVYDNAQILQNAKIQDNAQVLQNVKVYGNANVYDDAKISGHAKITEDSLISERAHVFGNSFIGGSANIYGNVQILGNSKIIDAYISGDTVIKGNTKILGYMSICEGIFTNSPLQIMGSNFFIYLIDLKFIFIKMLDSINSYKFKCDELLINPYYFLDDTLQKVTKVEIINCLDSIKKYIEFRKEIEHDLSYINDYFLNKKFVNLNIKLFEESEFEIICNANKIKNIKKLGETLGTEGIKKFILEIYNLNKLSQVFPLTFKFPRKL